MHRSEAEIQWHSCSLRQGFSDTFFCELHISRPARVKWKLSVAECFIRDGAWLNDTNDTCESLK